MNVRKILIRIARSLALDIQWIATPHIPEKWKFLVTKYLFIAFPFFFWDKTVKAYKISGWKQATYITNPDRIAHLQSIFIDHAHLKNIVPRSGILVDVGAHIGEFALLARTCLSPRQTYSFEPVPRSFELLQKNNNDTHFNFAIGADQQIKMYIDEQSGMSSKFKNPTAVGKTIVRCKSLDAIQEIQALPSIDLLKIDVEGMEYDVISSSPDTVRKSKYIVMETTLDRTSSRNGLSVISLLHQIAPTMELIYVGHIIRYADTGKQAAVDLVFRNGIE